MPNLLIWILSFILAMFILLILIVNLLRWIHYKVLFLPIRTLQSLPSVPYSDLLIDTRNGQIFNNTPNSSSQVSTFTPNDPTYRSDLIDLSNVLQILGLSHRDITTKPLGTSQISIDPSIPSSDYINLWHFNSYPGNYTILFCHGNYGNISHRNYIINFCTALKLNLVLFDYRGYGKSTGRPSIKGIFQDTNIAYQYLLKFTSPENIIIFSESLGGSVATRLASEFPCKCLILMSTFSSLDDILYYRNSHNLINSGLRMCLPRIIDSIPSKETIKKVKVPILIMHSKDDEVIPFECSQILYHNIQHPNKKFIEIRGGHTTPELKKENVDSLLDFCQIKKTTIYPLFVDTWLVELKNFVIHIKE